jgi:hypothetical protein
MTTPIDITSPVAGDDPLIWAQTVVSEVEAILGQIPGGNIQDGTIPKEALASGASVFAVSLPLRSVDTTDMTGFGLVYLPIQDGASRTYKLTGITITPALGGGTLTPTASSSLDTKVINGTTHAVISTDSVALTAAAFPTGNQPTHTTFAAARSVTSGNYVRVDYVHSGSPDYDNLFAVLWFETEHVAF